MNDLPPCDDWVFNYGRVLGVFDMPKDQAEAYCKSETARTGDLHDWHYVGGRVNILYLPTHIRTLLEELERLKIEVSKCRTWQQNMRVVDEVKQAEIDSFLLERDSIARWKERGEALVSAHRNNLMFRLGVWWAERPWRTHE